MNRITNVQSIRNRIFASVIAISLFIAFPFMTATDTHAADDTNPTEPPIGAIDIKPNEPVAGDLGGNDAKDWYSVTISAKGKARLVVESGGMMAPVFYTDYFRGKSAALQPKLSKIVSPYFRLPAGTYYILMKNNAGVEAASSYRFTFEYAEEGSSDSESEWNDTKETANSLALNKPLTGNLYDGIDTDWYKIVTTKAGGVKITFTRDTSVSADFANSFFYGNKTADFGTAKISYTEKTVTAAIENVPAGTSYIRIASGGSYANTNDYTLKAESTGPSKDATLKSLKKSTGTLMPAFKKTKTSYTLIIAKRKTSVKITPKTTSSKAKITIKNGGKFKSAKSTTVRLNRGKTKTISIRVTAEDKKTVKTYKIRVSREM